MRHERREGWAARIGAGACLSVILSAGVLAMIIGVGAGPLFSADVREQKPNGELLAVGDPNLLLHRSRYRVAVAEQYLREARVAPSGARPALRAAAAEIAASSLTDRPANPYALLAIATATHDLGRRAETLEALAVMRRFAKHHPATTPSRLVLEQSNWTRLSPQEQAELKQEVRRGHEEKRWLWRDLEKVHPGLAVLRASIGLER
ncbi:MAG: hypothetical protein AAGM38_07765 [Pseudomonadota bacterium]